MRVSLPALAANVGAKWGYGGSVVGQLLLVDFCSVDQKVRLNVPKVELSDRDLTISDIHPRPRSRGRCVSMRRRRDAVRVLRTFRGQGNPAVDRCPTAVANSLEVIHSDLTDFC